jgi:hypothetical protein
MKKDLLIFVLCGIAATTIESTGIFFMIPLASIIGAFVLTITKLNDKKSKSMYYTDEQLLDLSTRNDILC